MDPRDTERIPQPKERPIIGNVFDVRRPEPFRGITELAMKYGEIYKVRILRTTMIIVSSHAMLNELCDERRFEKAIHPGLKELRDALHDGLFTAYNDEPNWGLAHRMLVPAFGPLSVAGMFDSMKDIASQLVLKWLRHSSSAVALTQDFTRLTLDTIALCAMDYRFNSFYAESTHPFVEAMINVLGYPDLRGWLPGIIRSTLLRSREKSFRDNIDSLRNMARELVQQRATNPKSDTNDLLNVMLNGKDPKTGRGLDDESIIDNLITFLVAGHETTSGMLSFTMYHLLRNKEAYDKVKEEVDTVVGIDSVQPEHLNRLPYINAVLRESSRLQPSAPAIGFTPKDPQGAILGGKYHVARGDNIVAVLLLCHRDRAAYGEDAEEFRPERMLGTLPPNAWKTFGNGKRGCIGKGFAWQEMLLVMVMLFQHFDFELVDPDYVLHLDFILTIKPKDLQIRAIPRPNVNLTGAAFGSLLQSKKEKSVVPAEQKPVVEGKPITILYGSNSGTCEVFARTLANDVSGHGFKVSSISTLDTATRKLPASEPVIIVTASYEGKPTDDAAQFYEWLESLHDSERLESSYAIFGCGHADWKQTFHRIPKTLDQMLEQHGGQRICDVGLADASKGDMMSEFQTWEDTILWPALKQRFGIEETDEVSQAQGQSITIDVSSKRGANLRSDALEAKVLAVKILTGPSEPVKKHIVIELPVGTTYRAGDYCAVLPFNPRETVHRVMTRFSLPFDSVLKVSSHMGTTLPDEPISALDLFGAYLELSQPATRRNVLMLVDTAKDEAIKAALSELITGDFNAAVTEKRVSLLDLLERHPSIDLPLGSFVASLIPMRVRQYSIASSPTAGPQRVILVYDVLDGRSNDGGSRHIGVASNYLSSLRRGDIIHASIKASHEPFHIPSDDNIPIVMIAAGAGLAPFRGFIEERAAGLASGRRLTPAHLFFGCRGPARDDLYREELDGWEAAGAVITHRAYSRSPEQSGGYKHIDEVLLAERKLLIDLWERDAKLYVCGSRAVGESVKQAFLNIASQMVRDRGEDDAEDCMQRWFEGIRNQRYTTDVFT